MNDNKGLGETVPFTDESARKRFPLFGRRAGSMAVASSVDVVECGEAIGEDETLFGLEADLVGYTELWDDHFGVVTSFTNDETNEALLERVITECKGSPPANRDERKAINKLQSQDFPQFAAIFITAGRYRATLSEHVDTNGGIRHIMSSALTATKDQNRIDAKKAGILDNLKQSPSSAIFHNRLIELEKQSLHSYKPIVRKEYKMIDTVRKQITAEPDVAARLIDTFLETADSELRVERTFTAFLANDYLSFGDESLLGVATRVIEHAASKGEFAAQFLESRMAENDGDNMLAFLARAIKSAGIKTPLSELAAQDTDNWPTEMVDSYRQYALNMVNSYALSVKRQSEQCVRKVWLHPDVAVYEDTVDRLFKKLHSRYEFNEYNRPATKHTPPNRWRLNPGDALQVLPAQEAESKLAEAVLVLTDSGLKMEAAPDVDAILTKVLSREQLRDRKFVQDMTKIIEHLQINPRESGVRHLVRAKSVQINGSPTKMYRANPVHLTVDGYTYHTKRTKQARVIFAVTNGNLAVFKVPADHDEYERMINLLSKQ